MLDTPKHESHPRHAVAPINAMRAEGDRVAVELAGGQTGKLSTRWLRLACECDECGDTASGKRWLTPADVGKAVHAESFDVSTPGQVTAIWQDGHVSHYGAAWLVAHIDSSGPVRFQPLLWDSDLAARLGRFAFDAVVADDEALFQSLRALRDYGIAMLTGVPAETEATARAAGRYGPIRETSYGKVFDLISRPDARVAGETARAQIPHTDDPFRYAPPGFIFFHAIRTGAGSGGTSLMVDGFHVAELMRAHTPELFELLTRHGRVHAGEVDAEDLLAPRSIASMRRAPFSTRVRRHPCGSAMGASGPDRRVDRGVGRTDAADLRSAEPVPAPAATRRGAGLRQSARPAWPQCLRSDACGAPSQKLQHRSRRRAQRVSVAGQTVVWTRVCTLRLASTACTHFQAVGLWR